MIEIDDLEEEVGKPMFRPHRHMGAKGIREVLRWAHSDRGKYEAPEEQQAACDAAWCIVDGRRRLGWLRIFGER